MLEQDIMNPAVYSGDMFLYRTSLNDKGVLFKKEYAVYFDIDRRSGELLVDFDCRDVSVEIVYQIDRDFGLIDPEYPWTILFLGMEMEESAYGCLSFAATSFWKKGVELLEPEEVKFSKVEQSLTEIIDQCKDLVNWSTTFINPKPMNSIDILSGLRDMADRIEDVLPIDYDAVECALNKAIAALREKQEIENQKPLTEDQLRKMSGEPVWFLQANGKSWCGIIGTEYSTLVSKIVIYSSSGWEYFSDITAIPYRHKPVERSKNE